LNDIAQRLVESTVGAENRSKEFERFNVNTEATATMLAGGEVDLGVRVINVSPLTGRRSALVALPF
jgi:hypothetical protein